MVGIVAVALVAVGLAAWAGRGVGAGNGVGARTSSQCLVIRDADSDGIANGQDSDWTAPADGSGYADSGQGRVCSSCNGSADGQLSTGAQWGAQSTSRGAFGQQYSG
jgi:hypothetical protein